MGSAEGAIQKQIVDGLRKLGWRVLRLQSGKVRVRGGWMVLSPIGTPDVQAFDSTGACHWVEVKTPAGKRSPEQIDFEAWATGVGHKYACARSLAEVLEVFL
jgi:hypothetical protein